MSKIERICLPATSNWIEDGFGSMWLKCELPECDLHVVRPGNVQCSNYCGLMYNRLPLEPEPRPDSST